MHLYGLECGHSDCVHKEARCFRLYYRARFVERQDWMPETYWTQRASTGSYVAFRPPVTFLPHQIDALRAHIDELGGKGENIGSQFVEADKAHNLPPGADSWCLVVIEEDLPKVALYFRFKPDVGEELSSDKVFQLIFSPNADAVTRRCAPERKLTEEEFKHITRRYVSDSAVYTRDLVIKCQHCHRPLPIKSLNMLSLREVQLGD